VTELDRPVSASPGPVLADLQRFEEVVRDQLQALGLPDTRVFVNVRQRQRMLVNVVEMLSNVDTTTLGRSHYVSKMIAAAAVGLFDAALNYLWDETVSELRRRVEDFDISYFFDVAVPNNDLRKHLKTAEDLSKVDDANLLRGAREIGLLTPLAYTRLDHIRYMRNYASAAHPNQAELTGLDLANWLETCLTQVINAQPDSITAHTGRLLANIKDQRLDPATVSATAAFFEGLTTDRADTLAAGLFGLYTDPTRTPVIADNVRLLWPELWPRLGEDARHSFGTRFGRFQASADTGQAAAARELLDLVDASAYLPETTRVVEIDIALDALLDAHQGWNNFYTEIAPAQQLEGLIGDLGRVPEAVSRKYVRTLVKVYLGNGNGISWSADPIYRRLIQRLDAKRASRALRAFAEPEISSVLAMEAARHQWSELLDLLEAKLTGPRDRELLDAIRTSTRTPDQLGNDSKVSRLSTEGQRRSERRL